MNTPLVNKIFNILFYVVLAALTIYFIKQRFIAPKLHTENLQLNYFSGGEVDFDKLKGKVVILNFWQTWCGPCVGELASLNNMSNKWGDIQVLCITDETKIKVQSFIETYPNIHFVHIQDMNQANISSFPTTYVLNKQSAKVYHKLGAKEWDDDSFIATLKKNWN